MNGFLHPNQLHYINMTLWIPVLRLLYGSILLLAGISKTGKIIEFSVFLSSAISVSETVAVRLAVLLVASELYFGAHVIVAPPSCYRVSLIGSVSMLLIYTGFLVFSGAEQCRCFDLGATPNLALVLNNHPIARNLSLLTIGGILLVRRKSADNKPPTCQSFPT